MSPQTARLEALFAIEEHVEVEATWGIYQRIVAAYREPDKKKAKAPMQAVITSIASGVPTALVEIRRLGRTMKQRAADALAFFDRPGTSNGPTEAINGRLEHLRGSALGFKPHELCREITARRRRIQTPPTPSNAMRPFISIEFDTTARRCRRRTVLELLGATTTRWTVHQKKRDFLAQRFWR